MRSASAEVALDITGEPKLTLAGREGLLSARATAGKESSVPVVVTNTGTAPAENIQLSANAPSGWKIAFEPKTIDRIAPNEHKEVQALISPPGKAIAGDYVTTLTAATRGETGTANFRVTVTTSTVWGDRRRRHHRRRAADHGGRRRTVRPAMSEHRHRGQGPHQALRRRARRERRDVHVDAGEIFGLLGPNGAGKTTTILMLLGLSDISAGQARVFGHDPMREPLAVKRRVGYLPDSVGFYDHLTAADNLHYTARLMGLAADMRARSASPPRSPASDCPRSPTRKSRPSRAACASAWGSPKS